MNKLDRKIYMKEWRKNNKEHIKEYNKQWDKDNIEYNKQRRLCWKKENKKHILEYERKYYGNNKDKLSERVRKYFKTEAGKVTSQRGHSKRRARERNIINTLTSKEWLDILEAYNYRCAYCGVEFEVENMPTKDHIIPNYTHK